MRKILQYIVDAFADRVFQGNPAAVCVLESWLPEELMQKIAMENNFSETAFAVREGERWRLRWFTPEKEFDLCGHATLAAACVLFRFYRPEAEELVFTTLSGLLTVRRKGRFLEMDFPAYTPVRVEVTGEMTAALGVRPREAWKARDLLCVLDREEDVIRLRPDLRAMEALEGEMCIVTARGSQFDCVSRCFAPGCSVPEDPVTGSAHCLIAPYWAKRLGKTELTARQASARGGTLLCRLEGDRVFLAGRAVLYAKSELYVEKNAEIIKSKLEEETHVTPLPRPERAAGNVPQLL